MNNVNGTMQRHDEDISKSEEKNSLVDLVRWILVVTRALRGVSLTIIN